VSGCSYRSYARMLGTGLWGSERRAASLSSTRSPVFRPEMSGGLQCAANRAQPAPEGIFCRQREGRGGGQPRARHSVSAVHRPRRPLSRRCTSYPGSLVSSPQSPQCRPLPLLQLPYLPYPRLAPAPALVTGTATAPAPASPQIQPRHGDPPALHTPVHAARDRACDEPTVRVYARPLQVVFTCHAYHASKQRHAMRQRVRAAPHFDPQRAHTVHAHQDIHPGRARAWCVALPLHARKLTHPTPWHSWLAVTHTMGP
jgi:hypothetical protein